MSLEMSGEQTQKYKLGIHHTLCRVTYIRSCQYFDLYTMSLSRCLENRPNKY
ncbi:hypothetical protein J6590_106778, partial [Homalodisca vitripennis]